MTRLQKKCFLFSVGLHGLLLVILLGSSAFRDKPATKDMLILTMIPANIVDREGAGGGSPEPAAAAPQPAQPAQPVQPAQPAQPVVQTPPPVAQPHPVELVQRPSIWEVVKQAMLPASPQEKVATKPTHDHEIHPDFTPATAANRKASPTTEVSSSAEARRLRREIARSLDTLASGVKNSGAQGTVVDMPGQGGGEAFAGYETVIYNAYYHAWVTPDSVANRLAAADVRIVVERDGTILSAEIVSKSGEAALDRSVEKALRTVQSLPPFPASAHDEQRSFLIRFNLEAKEGSG